MPIRNIINSFRQIRESIHIYPLLSYLTSLLRVTFSRFTFSTSDERDYAHTPTQTYNELVVAPAVLPEVFRIVLDHSGK
jgi:hypothetical protein